MALPISEDGEDTLVEGRSVVGYFKKVDKNSRAVYEHNTEVESDVKDLKYMVTTLTHEIHKQNEKI